MKFLMISFATLLATQIYCLASLAEEGTKVPVKEGYGTLDMSEFNKVNANQVMGQKQRLTVTTSCTDNTGKTVRQGDAMYDSCLLDSANKANNVNTNGGNSNSQMNFNFGN